MPVEENFAPVARTRANYYTPGSPVQFVCVELLKGEISGEQAVCLTFKNISRVTLTALEIHFKCKGADGVVLCEDGFEYRDLNAKPGECFGMDDAVFVTHNAITSVDVTLKNVYNGNRVVHLDGIKRVRLPAPRRLSPELQKALEARMDRQGLKYQPQMLENGWYCACGAFHPKEEDTVYCSECRSDRILLQNALNTLLQPAGAAEPQPTASGAEATRVAAACPTAQTLPDEHSETEQTRVLDARIYTPAHSAPAAELDQQGTKVLPADLGAAPISVQPAAPAQPQEDDEDKPMDKRDRVAEALIRWVPPLTAIVCAGVALWGFVYYQFIL